MPPSIALLSRILKNAGIEVDIFDSTDYEIELDQVDADRVKSDNLQVIPYQSIDRISKGDVFSGFEKKVLDFKPDLIAMTSTESTFLLGISFLRELRNRNIHILTILGGVFATFAPWLVMRYPEIDICAVGEGEHSLLNLCKALERGEDYSSISGLWVKRGGEIIKNPMSPAVDIEENPTNLDISLFDDIRLYRPMAGSMYRMLSVETHRGCPFTCAFCNSPSQNTLFSGNHAGKFFRKKSPAKVKEEIEFYRDEYGIEYVFFWADTFLAYSKREFDEFCEMYSDIGLPFWCQTRAETITEHHMKKLVEIGLHRISFGVEHGNEKFRREVILRYCTNEVMIDAFAIVSDHGVPFNVNNIIGYPDETRELVFDTINLNRQFNAESMSCSILMPFHGTNLYTLSVDKGYIPPDVICPSNNDEAIMNMSSMSKDEIMGLSRTFPMYVKFPKTRWPEIARAEARTDEGNRIYADLRAEFASEFLVEKTG